MSARTEPYAASLTDVRAAAARIAGVVHRTAVTKSSALDALAGRRLFFKCECFQRAGSFKMRGASNAVLSLTQEAAARGVATHSSGNFAQALALAARERGIRAHIVMPRGSVAVKRRAVETFGGIVYECEPTLSAREETAAAVCHDTGATFIHPYDQAAVIAGQGTCALELVQEVQRLDAIVAPVGGGGLISGIAVAARGLDDSIRVYAAEPAGADDAARSKTAGQHIQQTDPRTIADGLRTSLGTLTWPIVRDFVEEVVTVEEESIVEAMRLVREHLGIVIEPSSAVAVAAVLAPGFRTKPGLARVGIVLSGGNVDVERMPG